MAKKIGHGEVNRRHPSGLFAHLVEAGAEAKQINPAEDEADADEQAKHGEQARWAHCQDHQAQN
jgi:hypothetical protein